LLALIKNNGMADDMDVPAPTESQCEAVEVIGWRSETRYRRTARKEPATESAAHSW